MSSNNICVIAATNSTTKNGEVLDYVQLASIAAERVKHFLGLETYLLTNDTNNLKSYPIFKDVIVNEPTKISHRSVAAGKDHIQYSWFNDTRVDAFKITKGLADKVLMIDADYMVNSDLLKDWVETDYPFKMFDRAIDVSKQNEFKQYFPTNDVTQRWATAMCWNNSKEAEVIFETARMVRDNYDFYASMFLMLKGLYRNDLAFSVACHLHNIPVKEEMLLWNSPPSAYIRSTKDYWIVEFEKYVIRWWFDIHVLNKQYAMDPELMNQLRLKNV